MTTTEQTVVIVGAGLAGASAAAELRKSGFDGAVTLLGAEPHRPYERPGLSKGYLQGQMGRDELDFRSAQFYEDKHIDLRLSTTVKAIDRPTQTIVTADSARVRYDRLLLATGAEARHLNIPGSYLPEVHYLRTIEDADAIMRRAARGCRVAVIGGGWIGAEVAASLRRRGNSVAMIAPGRVPLEGVLGTEVGSLFLELHREHGVDLRMGQRATAFLGRGPVEAVATEDGTLIEAGLVVVGVGARPRVDLAVAAGLAVKDGVVVDEYLRTSDPAIYAAGDVASAWHPVLRTRLRVEHWDNARAPSRVAANNILGRARAYDRIPYFYSDQFDLSMEYVGYAPRWDRVVYRGDPARRAFIAFWLTNGAVAAGMSVGISGTVEPLRALIATRAAARIDRLSDPAVPLEDVAALTAVQFAAPPEADGNLVAARAFERS
jgi:3-phenylpropionate/trans-cinnamate dioxygenase ferredoxin reductase subunit